MASADLNDIIVISSGSDINELDGEPLKSCIQVKIEPVSDDDIYFVPRTSRKMKSDGDEIPRFRRERHHSGKRARPCSKPKSSMSSVEKDKKCRSFMFDDDPPRIPPLPDLSEVLPSLYGNSDSYMKQSIYSVKPYHKENALKNAKNRDKSDIYKPSCIKKKRKSVDWYKTQSNAILGELFSVTSPSVIDPQSLHDAKQSEQRKRHEHHQHAENHSHSENHTKMSTYDKRRSSTDKKYDRNKRHLNNNHYSNEHCQKKVKIEQDLKIKDHYKNHTKIGNQHFFKKDKHRIVKSISQEDGFLKKKVKLKMSLSTGDQTSNSDIYVSKTPSSKPSKKAGVFEVLESLSQSEDDSTIDSCVKISPRSKKVPMKKCVTLLSDVMKLPCMNECKQKLNRLFINLSVLKQELARHEEREKHTDRHFLDVIPDVKHESKDDDNAVKACDNDSLTVDLLSLSENTDDEVNIKRSATPIILTESETSSDDLKHSTVSACDCIGQLKESVTNKSSNTKEMNGKGDMSDTKFQNKILDKEIIADSLVIKPDSNFEKDRHWRSAINIDNSDLLGTCKIKGEASDTPVLDSGDEDSSKNIEMDFSFKSNEYSDVSGDETGNNKEKEEFKVSTLIDGSNTDIIDKEDTIQDTSFNSLLYSDVSDEGENEKDFSFKSGKYSDVSGDELDSKDALNDLPSCSDKAVSTIKGQSSYSNEQTCPIDNGERDVIDNHNQLKADIVQKKNVPSRLKLFKRRNIFDIMSDSENSYLSDVCDSDIEFPAFEKDQINLVDDQEIHINKDSTVSSYIDIDKNAEISYVEAVAADSADIEIEKCKRPLCASSCDNIFMKLSNMSHTLVDTPVQSHNTPSKVTQPSSHNQSLEESNPSSLNQSVEKSHPSSYNQSHKEFHPSSLNLSVEDSHPSSQKPSSEVIRTPSQIPSFEDTNSPVHSTLLEDILLPLHNSTHKETDIPPQNIPSSLSFISPHIDDTSLSSSNTSLSTIHSTSSEIFNIPDKPFHHLNERSGKRKVRCSSRRMSTIVSPTYSMDLTPILLTSDYCVTKPNMSEVASQLSYYIQDYVNVLDPISDITDMPEVCQSMLQSCEEDDNIFNLDHALRFVQHFSHKYYLSTDIVHTLLKNTYLQNNEKHMNICLKIVKSCDSLYPGQIKIDWDNLNSCLATTICQKEEASLKEQISKLGQLKLFTHILRNNLFSKDLTDSRKIRSTDAYKLLRYDSISSKKKDLLYYVQQELETCVSLGIDHTGIQKDGKVDKRGEPYEDMAADLLEQLQMQEQNPYIGAVHGNWLAASVTLLAQDIQAIGVNPDEPLFPVLLSLCVDCSSSCVDCANSVAQDLKLIYLHQPHLEAKHRLLYTMCSPLLRYKLVQQLLENQYTDTVPFCSFPDSLEEVVQGFFWATPLKENSFEHDGEQTSLYIPEDTEELVMLLYYAVESYLQVTQGRLHMALRRRCQYLFDDGILLDTDREELARLPDHVTSLEKHLRKLTPDLTLATEHYLTMLSCLECIVDT